MAAFPDFSVLILGASSDGRKAVLQVAYCSWFFLLQDNREGLLQVRGQDLNSVFVCLRGIGEGRLRLQVQGLDLSDAIYVLAQFHTRRGVVGILGFQHSWVQFFGSRRCCLPGLWPTLHGL